MRFCAKSRSSATSSSPPWPRRAPAARPRPAATACRRAPTMRSRPGRSVTSMRPSGRKARRPWIGEPARDGLDAEIAGAGREGLSCCGRNSARQRESDQVNSFMGHPSRAILKTAYAKVSEKLPGAGGAHCHGGRARQRSRGRATALRSARETFHGAARPHRSARAQNRGVGFVTIVGLCACNPVNPSTAPSFPSSISLQTLANLLTNNGKPVNYG